MCEGPSPGVALSPNVSQPSLSHHALNWEAPTCLELKLEDAAWLGTQSRIRSSTQLASVPAGGSWESDGLVGGRGSGKRLRHMDGERDLDRLGDWLGGGGGGEVRMAAEYGRGTMARVGGCVLATAGAEGCSWLRRQRRWAGGTAGMLRDLR